MARIAFAFALAALLPAAHAHITFSPNTGALPRRAAAAPTARLRAASLTRRVPRAARLAPRAAVVKAPYFTTTMAVGHSTAGYSTQQLDIQTPAGVKVTPEQKAGARVRAAHLRPPPRHPAPR
jgi:hypothetical protein